MSPGNGGHPPGDPRQLDGLDTYPVAQVEAFVERIDELEAENKALRDRFSDADTERNAAQAALKAAFARVAALEAENKHLTQLLDGYRVHADAHRALLDKYDAERNGWLDIVGKASRAIDLFAKLEAREKQRAADEAWANDNGLIEFRPCRSGWVLYPMGIGDIVNATAPTIHGALRALREKMEAKP